MIDSLLILICFLLILPPRLALVRTGIIFCQLVVSSGSVVAFWGGGGILSKSWLSPAGTVRLGFSEGFLLQWRTSVLIRERLQSFCPSLAGCSCSSLCVTCVSSFQFTLWLGIGFQIGWVAERISRCQHQHSKSIKRHGRGEKCGLETRVLCLRDCSGWKGEVR